MASPRQPPERASEDERWRSGRCDKRGLDLFDRYVLYSKFGVMDIVVFCYALSRMGTGYTIRTLLISTAFTC